jgi:hypothetical protein
LRRATDVQIKRTNDGEKQEPVQPVDQHDHDDLDGTLSTYRERDIICSVIVQAGDHQQAAHCTHGEQRHVTAAEPRVPRLRLRRDLAEHSSEAHNVSNVVCRDVPVQLHTKNSKGLKKKTVAVYVVM